MNFLTVVVLLHSTLLATNEIDNVNGMNTNTDGRSPNKSKSSSPWKPGPRSYLAAFKTGPRPPESKVEKGAPSKQALINQKKRERKKMKKANGESSSAPSTPSTLGRSPEDESASTLPAIVKESSPLSSPSPSSSKSEPRQNQKSPTLEEESAVDESIEDESVTEDYPSLSSRAFKLAKKKYSSDSKTTETTVEGHQEGPPKKSAGSPPDRAEKQKELRDELALEVMSSRPTNGDSREVHRLGRFQSRKSAATKPRNSVKQKKEEPSVELTTQDRKVLEVDKTKPDTKEIQDESIAPASTSRATHDDEPEKIDQKSTDVPTETQSRELAEEQPTQTQPETNSSPTNTSQKESTPNEPAAKATPSADKSRSDSTAKFDDQKRQTYQQKNPSWKALKGFEEVPPPSNSSPRGRIWRQSHQGTVEGSSRAETWKQKQDMLRRAHAAPYEPAPYQFINKEKHLAKTKSDNSRGNQSSAQNGKNVWQQKEPQKLEKDERMQEDSPQPSYLRILSRQTENRELEHNETMDKEGPAQPEIDRTTPKGCEDNKDLQREKKLEGDSSLLGQNNGESANAVGTSRTNELPRAEAGGSPSEVDYKGEEGTKHEELPASPQRIITLSSPIDIPSKRIEMRKMSKEEAFDIDSTASTTSNAQFRLSDDEEKHDDTLPQTEPRQEAVGTELEPTVGEQTRPSEKIPSIAGTTVTTEENEIGSTQPNAETVAPGKEDTNPDEIPEGFSPAPQPSNITPPQMQKSDSPNSGVIEGKRGEAAKFVPIISVTPHRSPQNLLPFLKEVGIFNSEEANHQNDTSSHVTADPFENPSIDGDEVSLTEITDTPHRSHALGRRKPANALLITCESREALTRLELSTINPMAFGATDSVTLRGSGVIVKFDSSDGVQDLLKAMWDAEDISNALRIRSMYIFEHLLCVHHIPEDVQELQIVYRLRSQYNQEPIRVQFVPYIVGVHRGYKLALIDVGDSLLNEIEKNPLIQVRWMLRRIDVCLSPLRGKFPPEINMYIPQTPYPIVHDAVIVKIPADVSLGELNDSIYKKYGERPFDTQFKSYFRQNHMRMGKLKISETLLGKIYLSPYVQIRWSERLIITKMDLYRCTKCQRIGHLRYHCKGEERPEAQPHENCVDCSSNTAHPQNNVHHQTDSAECPAKVRYVLRCLAEQRAAKLMTMGSVPGPNQGWISQPAVRPFPQQSHGQISPFNRGVLPSSSLSNPPPQFRSTVGSVPGPNQGWISQSAVRPLSHQSPDQISPSSKGVLSSSPLSSSPLSNPPQFRSTAGSVPGPRQGWISQPVVRSFPQQSQDQISPSSVGVYSSSPFSNPPQLPRPPVTISAPPNRRMETLLETASSSSMSRNDTPAHPEAEMAVPAEEHEMDECDEASPNSVPELPEMESDIPDMGRILNEQDIQDIIDSLSLPTDTIDELIPDETASPGPPPHQLKKQIIFEAVRKSVYGTLQEALPTFYEIILEAVDRSVTETVNRLLPLKSNNKLTPSASFKTCDSGDLSSLPSDGPTENKEPGKGKEKVGRDDIEERTPSPLDPGEWYDEKHIVLVAGKSEQVNVFEELAKINIDWKQACIERPVIYPLEKVLLVCNSTEGAKYLRSVIKKSPTLKVLM